MHSQHITQPSLCSQTPGLFLCSSASISEPLQTWQRKRTWQKKLDGGSSVFIPAPVPFAVFTWVLSFCELAGVFWKRQLPDWLCTTQVTTNAYICGLLKLCVEKLKVHNRCYLNIGFCLSQTFPWMANSNNDLWIRFQKTLLKWKSHKTDGIPSLCPYVVNICSKTFVLMLMFVLNCTWKQWGIFPKRHSFGFGKDVSMLFGLITSIPREKKVIISRGSAFMGQR